MGATRGVLELRIRPINGPFLVFPLCIVTRGELLMGEADHVGYGPVEEELPEVGYAGWDGLFLSLSSVGLLHADYFPSGLHSFRVAQ